jgi:myo-inositol-1(or 4)-monophosphatase
MFFAEKGCGAFKEGFRNHERLRVAATKNADSALVACSAEAEVVGKVLSMTKNVRISGVSALDLAYLAAGKVDAVTVTAASINEIAAGILLVKEAGGYVFEIGQTDVRSENLEKVLSGGNLFATNEALKQKIAQIRAK